MTVFIDLLHRVLVHLRVLEDGLRVLEASRTERFKIDDHGQPVSCDHDPPAARWMAEWR